MKLKEKRYAKSCHASMEVGQIFTKKRMMRRHTIHELSELIFHKLLHANGTNRYSNIFLTAWPVKKFKREKFFALKMVLI